MSKELTKTDKQDEPQTARERAQNLTDDERMERERWQREDPAYIEKTRPEDPSSRQGQLTRDNVNPNIPSGKRGEPSGPIVDPNTLGMEQGGKAPANPMQPEHPTDASPEEQKRWQEERAKEQPGKSLKQGQDAPPDPQQRSESGELLGSIHSINEPPGSDVTPDVEPPPEAQRAIGKSDAAGDVREAEARDLSDPDEMEEELDEEEDDDDDKPRRTSTSKTPKKKK